jgi:small subunit ribosomal protein S20
MPIIKSAKKRVRVAARANAKNLRSKRSLRLAVKSLRVALTSGASKSVDQSKRKVQSEIDKAVKKGLIHKHKASRKQKQLSAQVKKTASTKITKKPVVKKTVAKKTPAKKTTKK